jgi:hypothetical protein
MKRFSTTIALAILIIMAVLSAHAQRGEGGTTFTGTAVIYGTGFNTRTVTRTFTLNINDVTSASEATRILNVLESDGQDAMLRSIDGNNLGRFSLGASVGQRLNTVLVDKTDGRTRIRAVFARWIGFGELRYGRRSVDYPFSYIELLIDPRTGRGEGTYFQAARIRSRGGNTIEIEDFGTFPSRLMGVQMRGRRLG